jgi:hypothetical protein
MPIMSALLQQGVLFALAAKKTFALLAHRRKSPQMADENRAGPAKGPECGPPPP